jgi:hypothetical protein
MTKRPDVCKRHTVVRVFCLLVAISATAVAQIQFDKPKVQPRLPNPSMISATRDELISVTKQMFEGREVPLDKEDCNQLSGECTLISKPVIFIKGITTRSQLEHYCEVPASNVKNWVRGRYTLRVQITPASPKTTQVGVYANFEGMTDGFSGNNEWVPLRSKGELEDKFLRCIQDRASGGDCKGIFEKER